MGRLHVRLTTALWKIATAEDDRGELSFGDVQAFAVAAGPSQGRDGVLLLRPLAMAKPGNRSATHS